MATTGNIKDMHYDFKQRLNRLDTNTNKNLQIPEIDRKLNDALKLYVLLIADPRIVNQLNYKKLSLRRNLDDISPIVVTDQIAIDNTAHTANFASLQEVYYHLLSVDKATVTTNGCTKEFRVNVVDYNDKYVVDEDYKSDLDWGELNVRITNTGLYIIADFTVDAMYINYLTVHPYIHNAEDFRTGGYILPNGTPLTGTQDSLFSDEVNSEIVDIAVLLASGQLELPNLYQLQMNALKIKQVIN